MWTSSTALLSAIGLSLCVPPDAAKQLHQLASLLKCTWMRGSSSNWPPLMQQTASAWAGFSSDIPQDELDCTRAITKTPMPHLLQQAAGTRLQMLADKLLDDPASLATLGSGSHQECRQYVRGDHVPLAKYLPEKQQPCEGLQGGNAQENKLWPSR